ncbi:MAG: primosomal protein N', partial [Sandaracinaceae bacterium]|nr:primosomal protein N' [Sandaracinaceae bacterium]
MSRFASVAIGIPRRELFTYSVPEALREVAQRGSRVLVHFNRRKEAGVIVALSDELPPELEGTKILPILEALDSDPYFTDELLSFIEEAARYYFHPLGEVLKSFSPPVRRDQIASLKREGLLGEGEQLRGVKARSQERDYVVIRDEVGRRKLGAAQARVMQELLAAGGEADALVLMRETGATRATLRRLEEMGLLSQERRLRPADPFFAEEVARDVPPELTAEQSEAVEAIRAAIRGGSEAFLLKGVTGSGKTEVYLRAIEEARRQDKGAVLLVPEISLTPQLVGRFRARFGDGLAVLHSGLDASAREAAMRALRAGEIHVAIGARSALFSPIQNLGLIIVDEEHDSSFKQEEGFRYQARDMALLRAHRAGAVAILGSATPSFESMFGAERGRLRLLTLSERATGAKLPSVEIVDLRRYPMGRDGEKLISYPLAEALRGCLDEGGQAIVFLNRRGYLPALRCEQCGAPEECPSCSVAMTAHKSEGRLRCHYCDHSLPIRLRCTLCGADALTSFSLGTEKLEEALSSQLSGARIARLDRDVVSHRSVERILSDFRAHRYDILVGTQMVTKGHDIPNVTVVGVVLADQSLSFSDFRAS